MDHFITSLQVASADFSLLIGFGVFLAYLVVDAMYAYYTLAITNMRPVAAATTGSAMHFLLALGVLSYTQNYLYIAPIALGSWIGTYLIMKREVMQRVNATAPRTET